MLAIERQNAIVQLVNQKGSITISELTAIFEVSCETIRKDLLLLEKAEQLLRTHGGAVQRKRNTDIAPLRERHKDCIEEKRELCEYAIRFIQNGDMIAIDEGSTGAELARLIACTFQKLTIATHSLEIFSILSDNPGLQLILLGGQYDPEELAFFGHLTIQTIQKLHFDKCFIFPSGISLKYGLMDCLGNFVDVQQAYLQRSDRVFALAYSERFEHPVHLKLDDMRREYTYITDSKLPKEIWDMYQRENLTIIKE